MTAADKIAEAKALIEVKPLEWHRSHMPSWHGDYHTVPTAYTVRCADENGWKWSGLGGHGYCSSPEGAVSAAQSDWERRIRASVIVRADALAQENAKLKIALRPFSDFPDPRNPSARRDEDAVWGWNGSNLTVGDFARARAALTPDTEAGQ